MRPYKVCVFASTVSDAAISLVVMEGCMQTRGSAPTPFDGVLGALVPECLISQPPITNPPRYVYLQDL